jgi:serine protease Do
MGRGFSSLARYAALVFLGSFGTLVLSPKAEFPFSFARLAMADDAARPASDETLQLAALEDDFESIAQKVSPAVVAISAATASISDEDSLRTDDLNGDRLGSFLDGKTRIVGTGFVIDADGYILTNEHVVGEAQNLWVTTDDRRVYPAIVIGSDPRADLAVLKIPATKLPTVTFARKAVKRGQWTIALGNPYGLATAGEMCMSVGVVSATDRSLPKLANKEDRLYTNLIQTTAEINPGNSGGPLFDLHGNVIGVNTAVILPQKQTNGIGFALPITDNLLAKIDALKQGKEIVYGYLGVRVVTPTARQVREAGLDRAGGALVELVETDSPAAKANLRNGDLITKLNGQTVKDADHFVRLIGECSTTQPTQVKAIRDKRDITLSATIGKRSMPAVAITRETQRLRWRGMLLGPIPSHWSDPSAARPEIGLMVLAVESDTHPRGIAQGTIITEVAGRAVSTIADLQRIINDTPPEQCSLRTADVRSVVVTVE